MCRWTLSTIICFLRYAPSSAAHWIARENASHRSGATGDCVFLQHAAHLKASTMGAAVAGDTECRDVDESDPCYEAVNWAMQDGIDEHPEWYPGLTPSSSFKEFQQYLHDIGADDGACPAPCSGVTPAPAPSPQPAPQPGAPQLRVTVASLTDGSGQTVSFLQVEGAEAVGTPGGPATSEKRTVYFFTRDDGAGAPTYSGDSWPIVLVPEGAAIAAPADLPVPATQGTGRVLLIDGKPAYQFTADTSAASASGNGAGGVWFWFEVPAQPGSPSPTRAPAPAGSSPTEGSWERHELNCYVGNGADYVLLPEAVGSGDSAHVPGLTLQRCRELCVSTSGCTAITVSVSGGDCFGRQSVEIDRCAPGGGYFTELRRVAVGPTPSTPAPSPLQTSPSPPAPPPGAQYCFGELSEGLRPLPPAPLPPASRDPPSPSVAASSSSYSFYSSSSWPPKGPRGLPLLVSPL